MAAFAALLADSLTLARRAARDNIVRTRDLPRAHRERLLRAGWLMPVVRGWYILGQPAGQGETAHWHASCWAFVRQYLHSRFGDDYCLSADASIDLHLDQNALPAQLVVMTGNGGGSRLDLPHNASLLMYEAAELPENKEIIRGVQAMPLAAALCRCAPALFSREPVKAEIALRMADAADVSRILLAGGRSRVAARLAGAYRFLGDEQAARDIEGGMEASGHQLRPENPFAAAARRPVFGGGALRITSPYAARIRAQWAAMRGAVAGLFPKAPGTSGDSIAALKRIKALYQHDAYHSLSIEGYEVTPELIMRVRAGEWNPDENPNDAGQRNAMAAKGYADAFDAVCASLQEILDAPRPAVSANVSWPAAPADAAATAGAVDVSAPAEPAATVGAAETAGAAEIAQRDFHGWYQALFSPGVRAGIIEPASLAGYRGIQVYIRGSAHVPPPQNALLDAMDAFFDCLSSEPSPIAAALLGHFFFGFIHPYMDGNGRVARFLMNVMLVSAGYPWTIIRSEQPRRARYMQSLEQASTKGDIRPFAEFIAEEMAVEW